MKVYKNSAKCLLCNEVLISKSVHDFVTCTCGNLSVDGGTEYIKRSVGEGGAKNVEELCEYLLNTEEWYQFVVNSKFLECLEETGVDNWEGYDDAVKTLHERGF